MSNESPSPIAALGTVEASDSAKKAQQARDLNEAEQARSKAHLRLGPANHVAPAAHAAKGTDPAVAAAVSEERGRDAVERIEGTDPLHALHPGQASDAEPAKYVKPAPETPEP